MRGFRRSFLYKGDSGILLGCVMHTVFAKRIGERNNHDITTAMAVRRDAYDRGIGGKCFAPSTMCSLRGQYRGICITAAVNTDRAYRHCCW